MFLPPFNESVVLSVHKVYLLTILCWPNDGFTSQLYHLKWGKKIIPFFINKDSTLDSSQKSYFSHIRNGYHQINHAFV